MPVITIFVRHSAGCKYAADEFARRCNCRKHPRWTLDGTQHRRSAQTRSWAEAEKAKRAVEDQLSGNAPAPTSPDTPKTEDVTLFVVDKKIQGLTPDLIKKYTLWLGRLQAYCERRGVLACLIREGVSARHLGRYEIAEALLAA